MPKRESEYKAKLLVTKEGEFFPFWVSEIVHQVSKFDLIDPLTKEPVLDEATGKPVKKEQLCFSLRTEVDGEVQEITEWVGNAIPNREFNERNKLGKLAKAFQIVDELLSKWKGFNLSTKEEIEALKALFKGKTAEGLIKIVQSQEGLPIVKVETWRVCKTPAVTVGGKKKAPF